jgi:hypothetical protein
VSAAFSSILCLNSPSTSALRRERLADLVVVREREVVWGSHTLKVAEGQPASQEQRPLLHGRD